MKRAVSGKVIRSTVTTRLKLYRDRFHTPTTSSTLSQPAFAQLKADAPTEWSFSSLEEDEEIDDADWWKTRFLMGLCRPLPTFSRVASS